MKEYFRLCIALFGSSLLSPYAPSFLLHATEVLKQLDDNNYEINQKILNRSPAYFWNEKKISYQSKGSAGVVPYGLYNGKIYLLIARESRGKYKDKYCDLGGAVEVYGSKDSSIYVDTFLSTVLKEAEEESGGLYKFNVREFMENSYTLSCTWTDSNFYNGFESVLSFFEVNKIYLNNDFIRSSQNMAKQQELLGLCPTVYQEKDDYQWIEMKPFSEFLERTEKTEGYFKNILNQTVKIKFRTHFLKILRSKASKELLNSLTKDELSDAL